jgi:amino-acid N-acetyltransferase
MGAMDLVLIDSAGASDLDDIKHLLELCKLPVEDIENHVSTALVARRGEVLIGCAAVEIYEESGLLRSVAVHPDLENQGLGEQLVMSCLDLARRNRLKHVYLLTETAAGYFPRFGFINITREAVDHDVRASVEFTTACQDDAQAMVLDLANPD